MDIPEKVVIDIGSLTLGDLEDLEKLTDMDTAAAALAGRVGMRALVALTYITLRRTHPDVTLEAIRAMPIDTDVEIVSEDEANPTPAEGATT